MKVFISKTSKELGVNAAAHIARQLRKIISVQNCARIVLSTGASQFDTLGALVKEDVDWRKVEVFHLDEYVGLSVTHPASFRKYLQERFVSKVPLKAFHPVNGEGNIIGNIRELSAEILSAPIDIGLIGIGENAHIAFNDPPANFNTIDPYIIVDLDDSCKQQQVGEGWFKTIDAVPSQAISMSVHQIMKCREIVCCVPDLRKANAIRQVLAASEVTNLIPATKLKEHPCVRLYLDEASSSMVPAEVLKSYVKQEMTLE